MAAWRADTERGLTEGHGVASVVPGPVAKAGRTERVQGSPPRSVSARPLLPIEPERRPRRHLFLSELDGPDYEEAVDMADRLVVERDRALFGDRALDRQAGWSRDAA